MILISHRGNINTVNLERENTKSYIQEAIDLGYDVEIDVRYADDKFWLGHDEPDYEVELEWLLERKNNLWIHCKNFLSLARLINTNLRIFYHQDENHTIIGNTKAIWSHDIDDANHQSIIPLIDIDSVNSFKNFNQKYYGICSDFIKQVGDKLN
tara:strand:+ start:301 stop:762 length:462 start_codon:yes stop_codon:yes gene_type:complete